MRYKVVASNTQYYGRQFGIRAMRMKNTYTDILNGLRCTWFRKINRFHPQKFGTTVSRSKWVTLHFIRTYVRTYEVRKTIKVSNNNGRVRAESVLSYRAAVENAEFYFRLADRWKIHGIPRSYFPTPSLWRNRWLQPSILTSRHPSGSADLRLANTTVLQAAVATLATRSATDKTSKTKSQLSWCFGGLPTRWIGTLRHYM